MLCHTARIMMGGTYLKKNVTLHKTSLHFYQEIHQCMAKHAAKLKHCLLLLSVLLLLYRMCFFLLAEWDTRCGFNSVALE